MAALLALLVWGAFLHYSVVAVVSRIRYTVELMAGWVCVGEKNESRVREFSSELGARLCFFLSANDGEFAVLVLRNASSRNQTRANCCCFVVDFALRATNSLLTERC